MGIGVERGLNDNGEHKTQNTSSIMAAASLGFDLAVNIRLHLSVSPLISHFAHETKKKLLSYLNETLWSTLP
jgi:uncharacterized NAD-dependent epimerase/dehydratase family protein